MPDKTTWRGLSATRIVASKLTGKTMWKVNRSTFPSSVDRAPARCSGGHGFDFCRRLRFFLCSRLVLYWSVHFSHFITKLKIYHLCSFTKENVVYYHHHDKHPKYLGRELNPGHCLSQDDNWTKGILLIGTLVLFLHYSAIYNSHIQNRCLLRNQKA